MALFVLAYPNLQKSAFNLIQEFRKANDELFYSIVEPHFTIVFPTFDKTKEEFCQTILDTAREIEKINFNIWCAKIYKNPFTTYLAFI